MPAGISFQIAGAKYLIPKAARIVSRYSTIKLSAFLVSYLCSERFTRKKLVKTGGHTSLQHQDAKQQLHNLKSDQC